jgi:hypothetical protein
MTSSINRDKNKKIQYINENPVIDRVKILSKLTKRDIEQSYNLDNVEGTEAYFSERYGWTLRRTIL